MARRKSDSPQKAAMREMMQGYLNDNDISIKSGNDVNSIMRDMMSVLLEGALDEELNEELGYSKYDYRNKEKQGFIKQTDDPEDKRAVNIWLTEAGRVLGDKTIQNGQEIDRVALKRLSSRQKDELETILKIINNAYEEMGMDDYGKKE